MKFLPYCKMHISKHTHCTNRNPLNSALSLKKDRILCHIVGFCGMPSVLERMASGLIPKFHFVDEFNFETRNSRVLITFMLQNFILDICGGRAHWVQTCLLGCDETPFCFESPFILFGQHQYPNTVTNTEYCNRVFYSGMQVEVVQMTWRRFRYMNCALPPQDEEEDE